YEVVEGVQALRPGAAGRADTGCDQARPGPVVELPVGDADDPAHLGDAVALCFHHRQLRNYANVRKATMAARAVNDRPPPPPSSRWPRDQAKSSGVTCSRNSRNFSTS